MIPDVVRRLAVRDLPHDLALVQIDRRDAAIRRLDQRQALDEQTARRCSPPAPTRGQSAGGAAERSTGRDPGIRSCPTVAALVGGQAAAR